MSRAGQAPAGWPAAGLALAGGPATAFFRAGARADAVALGVGEAGSEMDPWADGWLDGDPATPAGWPGAALPYAAADTFPLPPGLEPAV
jgi:hypothetical protein